MNRCPSEDLLRTHAEPDPEAPEEFSWVSDHLVSCATCRERMASLRDDDALFSALRTAVHGGAGSVDLLVSGRYDVLGELSRGGQATVYEATRKVDGHKVAIKVIHGGTASPPAALRRFEREAELVARLEHPGVVRLLESGVSRGAPFLVMELVDGSPLDRSVEDRGLSIAERLALFVKIGEAVAHAHGRGVLHRDLKPSNILVDRSGAPRILDFGIARALIEEGDATRLTATGEFVGTLVYAAPERLEQPADQDDTRADVYSLGVVLYHLVTGTLPFDLEGPVANMLQTLQSQSPKDPAEIHSGVDDELRTVLLRAIARDRERRYPTVDALVEDVQRYLDNRPVLAKDDSTLYVLRKWATRNRRTLSVAATLLVGGVVGGWQILDARYRASEQKQTAVRVSAILQDLIASASPSRMGRDVSILEVIEQAASRIEDSLGDSPDVQAALHLTIGETYRNLRMLDDAEPHLRAALQRYRVAGSALDVAGCLDVLGLVLSDRSLDEAVGVQREALAIRRRELGDDHDLVDASRRHLGMALAEAYRAPDISEASALFEEALASFRQRHPEDHPEVAKTLLCIARVELEEGRSPEALVLVERAVATLRNGPSGNPDLERALSAYASLLQRQGRFDDAEVCIDEIVEWNRRTYGDERMPSMMRVVSRHHVRRGDRVAAFIFLRRSVAHELRLWADRRPSDRHVLESLAAAVENPEDPEAPRWKDAFERLIEYRGTGSFELAAWMNQISEAEEAAGRLHLSAEILNVALVIHCRVFGEDCPVRESTYSRLAEVHLRRGLPMEALKMAQEAARICERVSGSRSPEAEELIETCRAAASAQRG